MSYIAAMLISKLALETHESLHHEIAYVYKPALNYLVNKELADPVPYKNIW